MLPIPVVLIGAGQRGARAYASYALRRPEEIRIVAVAEPNDHRRNQFAAEHQIPHGRCFRTWEDLLDAPVMADAALICTPDNLHVQPTMNALQAGYHVLLETPLAPTPQECIQLTEAAQFSQQQLIVSHSLRYTAFYRALHDIISSGRLGNLVSYKQDRAIAFWQVAHQFIRNAPQPTDSNPILFSEGIHELDLMIWLLKDKIETVSAVGSTTPYRLENAPITSLPQRCVDDCPIEAECQFSAIGTYLEKRYRGIPQRGFPHTMLADGDETPDALVRAIENTRWGKCVYQSNVELIDHQTILMKNDVGTNIGITINAHSSSSDRTIQIDGSHGSLTATFTGLDSRISFYDPAIGKENVINFRLGPHGHGGDHGLMGNLTKMLRGETESLTLASQTLNAHLLAFAANEARQQNRVINFPAYCAKLR